MDNDEKKAKRIQEFCEEIMVKLQVDYPSVPERAQVMAVMGAVLAGVALTYSASCGLKNDILREFEGSLNEQIPFKVELREKL